MKENVLNYTQRKTAISYLLVLAASLLALSCMRGKPSTQTPIHLNPNMDDQARYDAMEASPFFADGREMRVPPAGTVARDEFHENDAFYYGKNEKGAFVDRIPMKVTEALMKRGQERYNIYCAPCHSRAGDGNGIVPKRGFLKPPSFHQDNIRSYPDGKIFDIISNGIRNMPAYRKQIWEEKDRWAIVAYVRALQRTHNATAADVPVDKLNQLK
ncbi:MAG: cytochrome c [Calditrichaeota bacterium]|nr:MAG: cytochrome c [Calditrichota bacterium]